MTIVHLSAEVKLYPQTPNPRLSTLEIKLFFVRVESNLVSLTSWDFTLTWCLFRSTTLWITGLDGTTQIQQHKAKQLKRACFLLKWQIHIQGTWDSWVGINNSSATLPQTLPNTQYTDSKSSIAPRVWRQRSSVIITRKEARAGQPPLVIYLRYYHANHTNKIW